MEVDRNYNLQVGMRIRNVREILNMTREQFSEACDISSSFLAAIESGQKAITSKTLYKICKGVHVSANYIILGNENDIESDMVMEMLHSIDDTSKTHAIRILHEFIESVYHLQEKND